MKRLWTSFAVGALICVSFLTFTLFSSHTEELNKQLKQLQNEISATEVRIDRLTNENVRTEFPRELVWNVSSKVDAELRLQKTALNLSSETDLELVAFNVPNTTAEAGSKRASFSIEAEGSLDDVLQYLSRLENHEPRIAIKSLRIRPSRSQQTQAGQVPVYVQATLWSFWKDEK